MCELFIAMVCVFLVQECCYAQAKPRSATAAKTPSSGMPVESSITGTYASSGNIIRVQKLTPAKVKVSMSLYWAKGQPNEHLGTFLETLPLLKNNRAVYVCPDDDDSKSKFQITMMFSKNQVIVTQEGTDLDCVSINFGANVNATGTYKKTSSKIPVFPKDEE